MTIDAVSLCRHATLVDDQSLTLVSLNAFGDGSVGLSFRDPCDSLTQLGLSRLNCHFCSDPCGCKYGGRLDVAYHHDSCSPC